MGSLFFMAGIFLTMLSLPFAACGIVIAVYIERKVRPLIFALLGLCAGLYHIHVIDADLGMPTVSLLRHANVIGHVVGIPQEIAGQVRFIFDIEQLNQHKARAHIQLSCYQHCPALSLGDRIQATITLKKPTNLRNLGGYDYVRHLAAQHIHWQGYLDTSVTPSIHHQPPQDTVLAWRMRLAKQLEDKLSQADVVEALTLGMTQALTPAAWDLFRRTGTTHLMVISGAHIALIAGLIYQLVYFFWSRRASLCLRCPAQSIAGISSLISAALYALLAGFGVPAKRAFITCSALIVPIIWGRRMTPWQAWRYAACMVLCWEPHAAWLPGFYLSFMAVAILMVVQQRVQCHWFLKGLILQLACLVGLMPFTLFWFSYGAVNGFIANLIAIPLVGYLLLPISFIVLLTLPFHIPLLHTLLDVIVQALLSYLRFCDHLSALNVNFTLTNISAVIASLVVLGLIVVLPLKRLLPAHVALLLAACFKTEAPLPKGAAEIAVLDVGQGLSVVVHTKSHTLVYDTGMAFRSGNDMGKLAIIPYLQAKHVKHLDAIVISHPDLDHRGGLKSILMRFPASSLLVNDVSFYGHGKLCHTYPAWMWDGVSFRFLPIKLHDNKKNNSSCVLKVSTTDGSVLLTGDIEALAEKNLVQTYGEQLRADVLVVPHHGSKTSSTPAFIQAISPQMAIISAGQDNRYHFPHAATLSTLHRQGVKILNTAKNGGITITLPSS